MTAVELHSILMRKLHATAKNLRGWTHDDLKYYASKWGYGDSIGKLSIDQLKGMIELIEMGENKQQKQQEQDFKPIYTKLMQETIEAAKRGYGEDMATFEQVKRSCILQSAYCQFRKIPFHLWDACFREWMSKYWKIDSIRWCTRSQASDVLSAQGRLIRTTFGNDKYALVTGEHWQNRGEKYKKYGGAK